MNLSTVRSGTTSRAKLVIILLMVVGLVVAVTACEGDWDLFKQDSAQSASTTSSTAAPTTTKPENLNPPSSVADPPYDPVELWKKCQEGDPTRPDSEKEADGTTTANCSWAQAKVKKLQDQTSSTTTVAPGTTAAPTSTEAPTTTAEVSTTTAPSTTTTTTKPSDMDDVVAKALMFQAVAEQNGYHLGIGVTCQVNCVLLQGIQGETDAQKAWSLLSKAVMSPVYLDDAARTVRKKCDCYTDTRPIGNMAKAADDYRIVMEAIMAGKGISSGTIPAGTLVYNTVVQDGQVVQFVYTTTKDRAYVQFDLADGTYLRFFTTCGNRTEEAPPGTPETPNPPCHDDTPVPCTPPCEHDCDTTTTVCQHDCTPSTTERGKQDGDNVLNNTTVPPQQGHGSSTVAPVPSQPVTPTTTGTGCGGDHPCPTNPTTTSNPGTTQPVSCSQEPTDPNACHPAPTPPKAPPSSVTTTTHVVTPSTKPPSK